MPYIAQVASGLRDYLSVYGNDYNTVDGTGVRDFIHVMDLAAGHLKALEYLGGFIDIKFRYRFWFVCFATDCCV